MPPMPYGPQKVSEEAAMKFNMCPLIWPKSLASIFVVVDVFLAVTAAVANFANSCNA